ncbi:MAG: hypothetical protein R3F47_19785 [Gammaproteobacteria bacterium]
MRDLHKLAVNFVNFQQFYQRKTPAIFRVGTCIWISVPPNSVCG